MSVRTLFMASIQAAVYSLLWASPAFAVWNESVAVIGDGADAIQAGTSITLTLNTGSMIDGEVVTVKSDEEDDDKKILYIRWDGNLPLPNTQAGTFPQGLIALTIAGKERTFRIGERSAGDVATINLETDELEDRSFAQSDRSGGLSFGIIVGGTRVSTEQAERSADISAVELSNVIGLPGDIRSSADSSTSAWTAGFVAGLRADGSPWQFNVVATYTDMGDLDLSVVGSFQPAPGLQLDARAAGTSEEEFWTVMLEAERFLANDRLSIYGSIGGIWAEREDKFVSTLILDGQVLQEITGSSEDSDNGFVVGLGIRGYISPSSVIGLGVQQANGIFGESQTNVAFTFTYWFF